ASNPPAAGSCRFHQPTASDAHRFLDNLVYRLHPADRFKRDLGVKLTTKILAFLLSHRQLLFTAGYPLKGLPGNWDPLY
ncbi:MAG: hypothetical protein ABIP64_04060, partial [Burkholderiales bacterium]